MIAAAREAGRAVLTRRRGGDGAEARSRSRRDGFAQRLRVAHGGKSYDIRLPLLGDYQASNALLAAGLAIAAGEPAARVLPALAELEGVKGRLEIVGRVRGGLIVIDYAHKPDALAAALKALRPFAPGRLVCVFGCGGDRDKGKRPIMGRIAARLANHVIVTDDNPRSEKPEAIRAEILAGAPGAREIGDRAEAIRAGARLLGHGDVLLIAGKGHETGQIVGSTRPARSRITRRCVPPWRRHPSMAEPLWQWEDLVAAARRRRPTARRAAPSRGFSIDTRSLEPGDVFVALKDARDGHEFVAAAFKAGAAAAIVSDAAIARGDRPAARCCASTIRCARWKPSDAPRARAATRASSPSPAASARPAPRRCCACAWRRRADARRREVLQQPLGRAADAGAHAARQRIRACSRSA